MSVLGNAWGKLDDWMMEGSTTAMFTKVLGVTVGLVALVASPFVYYAYRQSKQLDRDFDYLNKTPTAIFTSIDQCVEQGYTESACQCSWDKAADIASSLGTSVSYSSAKDAAANHYYYERHTTLIPHTTMVGKVSVTSYSTSTSYSPSVYAWQADKDDICGVSVPLYVGQTPDMAVRRDGQTFQLKP